MNRINEINNKLGRYETLSNQDLVQNHSDRDLTRELMIPVWKQGMNQENFPHSLLTKKMMARQRLA